MWNIKIFSQDAIESLKDINKENEERQIKEAALPYWKQIGYQVPACEVKYCEEPVIDTGHLLCENHLHEMCEDMAYRWK